MKPYYNKVLITHGFYRKYQTKLGTIGIIFDGSSLQFIIEEFIASSALEIAIDAYTPLAEFKNSLPKSLQKRVIIVNTKGDTFKKRLAIFAPIAEEFNLNTSGVALTFKKKLSHDISQSIATLYFSLYTFLLGIEYKLQIDVNLAAIKNSIATLRNFSRNPDARAILSIFQGIFNVYSPRKVDFVTPHPTTPQELINIFHELIEDETFRYHSRNIHLLGYPNELKKALAEIKKLTRRLLKKAPFKQLLNLISRGATTATRIPIPDSDMIASLLQDAYLPPIISSWNQYRQAEETWKRNDPEFVGPEEFSKDVLEWDWNTNWNKL